MKVLLKEHFRIFCTYRFYNSHSKAMMLQREEIRKNIILRGNPKREYKETQETEKPEIENEEEFDKVFLSRDTIRNFKKKDN